MSRVKRKEKKSSVEKIIDIFTVLIMLFWIIFWPIAYFTSYNIYYDLKENIKNSENIPIKEKIRIIGENI